MYLSIYLILPRSLAPSHTHTGEALGLDPLTTTIPLTFAALAADQTFLKGAVFETSYQVWG